MVLRKSRVTADTSELFDKFNASIHFDVKLFDYDIIGSLAHVNMLHHCEIITKEEAQAIQSGLIKVQEDFDSGKLTLDPKLEDVHMNIEAALTEIVGEVGKKVHTARSRNDQVALDVRLYLRDITIQITDQLNKLTESFVELAEKHQADIIPGYTHLQKAQPVLLSHHLLAYAQMFSRDTERFEDSLSRLNLCPLGAGAIAGTSFPIDREYLARLLKFSAPTANSIDTVSDRDHLLEFLSNCSIAFTHLSRLSEELIIWASDEFSFVNLPDEFCTTSSMMPQKKNPDLLELVRGKSGRINGNLISLLTTVKGLSLAYFKDLQEDKEPLFDSAENTLDALQLISALISQTEFNTEKMLAATQSGFLEATDAADYLVNKGLSFREAHEVIGQLVSYCTEKNIRLAATEIDQLQKFSKLFAQDFYKAIDLKEIINCRSATGSAGLKPVTGQIRALKEDLDKNGQKSRSNLSKNSLLV